MAFVLVYEPQYRNPGWFDDSGRTVTSWLDRDVANDTEVITAITLGMIDASFYDDADAFFVLPPITVVVFPELFLDEDLFFHPATMRALDAPDTFLKNEVIRIR
jgi:hypothetical protein